MPRDAELLTQSNDADRTGVSATGRKGAGERDVSTEPAPPSPPVPIPPSASTPVGDVVTQHEDVTRPQVQVLIMGGSEWFGFRCLACRFEQGGVTDAITAQEHADMHRCAPGGAS